MPNEKAPEPDIDAALTKLSQAYPEAEQIGGPPTCPGCLSQDVDLVATTSTGGARRCRACGHEWRFLLVYGPE